MEIKHKRNVADDRHYNDVVVDSLQIFTLFSQISCWSLNMTLALVPTADLDQAGKALFAAWTASLNSASVDNGTLEMTSWVACRHREVLSRPATDSLATYWQLTASMSFW